MGLPTVLNSFFNGEYDTPCVTEEDTEKDYSISFPNITCFGDKYSVIINSNRKEEFNAEFVKIYPNNENELISSINSQNYSVTFSGVNNIEDKSHFLEVFEVRIKTKSNNYDTLTFSLKYGFCCGNTVKNSNFGAIAAGSTCFTVEYFTDLDFRTSQSSSCPYLFTSYGQLASSSYAMWHNTNFDKTAKSAPFFLIGDPLPNIEQRAWYQENPTRVGTRYKFSAYVCNLEKISRAEENGRKLNIWLSIKNRFQDLKLKKIEDIRFEDDWVEISDEFIANDNSTELAIWILGESPDMKVPSYGFGIDNISLIPLPEYNLDVIKDTLVCVNETIKLENHFDGEISSINWFPITGLDEPNSLSPIVTPTETTTYTLKIHDRYYCEFTKNIVVSIDSCLDKCRPDVSIYLENSEIEIGKDFCINGIFVPECELNSYLDEIKLYFKFDPKLLKFKSSSSSFNIYESDDQMILVLTFNKLEFSMNYSNEFKLCFTALLGYSNVTNVLISENDDYNLVDYTNSKVNFLSCEQPYLQIKSYINNEFKIYQRNGELHLSLSTEEQGKFSFIIMNIKGQVLYTVYFSTSKNEYINEEILNINLDDLSAGSYFLRMITPYGKIQTKKFIID